MEEVTTAHEKCYQIWRREKVNGRVTTDLTEWRRLKCPRLWKEVS